MVGDSGDTGIFDEIDQSHTQEDLHGDGQRILGDDQVNAKPAHKRLKRGLQVSGKMRENPPGPTRWVETKPILSYTPRQPQHLVGSQIQSQVTGDVHREGRPSDQVAHLAGAGEGQRAQVGLEGLLGVGDIVDA